MSNHTKAPWSWQAESENLAYLVESDDATIIARLSADDVSNNFSRVVANTRRIVACVNACEGISTENLEDNKPIIELANDYNAALKQLDVFAELAAFHRDARLGALKELAIVERQRDELLAACLKTLSENGHLADGDNCTLIDIKLAIRRVEGGAE